MWGLPVPPSLTHVGSFRGPVGRAGVRGGQPAWGEARPLFAMEGATVLWQQAWCRGSGRSGDVSPGHADGVGARHVLML